MKRQYSNYDRARRYSQALVDASLTARRSIVSSRQDGLPATRLRWRSQPALWLERMPTQHDQAAELVVGD